MRSYPGELLPAQAVSQHVHALQRELQQARQSLRRERRLQEPSTRWNLDRSDAQSHDEEWLITYLDMVTLLMVAMIMMLALAGPLRKSSTPALQATATTPASSNSARSQPPMLIPIPDEEFPYPAAPADAFAAGVPAPSPATAPLAGTFPDPEPPQDLHPVLALNIPSDAQSALTDAVRAAAQHGSAVLSPAPLAMAADASPSPAPAPGPAPSPAPSAAPAPAPFPVPAPAAILPAPALSPRPVPAAADAHSEGETVAASLALGALGKDVEVIVNKRSVSFRVNSEILFGTGQADLSPEGLAVLKRMAQVLVKAGYDITVEGHTDSVRVRSNAAYPSNWELSSARAGRVVRYLLANGIPKSHLRAVGFADSRPIADNNTPEGRARNRRVELVVAKHHEE